MSLMDSNRIARLTYSGETVLVPIFKEMTYDWFRDKVVSRFKDLRGGDFRLSYSIPDCPCCKLESDMDVQMMLGSLSAFSMPYVDISIKELYSSILLIASVQIQECSPTLSADCSDIIDPNDYLGDFGCVQEKRYLSNEWVGYIRRVGQGFKGGRFEFREKLLKYAIQVGFNYVYVKNDKKRVTAECLNKVTQGCRWRIYASLCTSNNWFYIKTLNNVHTCQGVFRVQKSLMMCSQVVSSLIKDKICANPLLRPIDIRKDIKDLYGLDITYQNAWKGKEIARCEVQGDDILSYQLLVWYINVIEETNPGSYVKLECDMLTFRFRRFLVSFHGYIEGFKWCIPLLFVDGTFIKNKYKGQLLADTGKNGDQGFFPLAFAVVDSESEDNWTWFCQILHDMLSPQGRNITFMSDRNARLLDVVSRVFPNSPHFYCYQHLKRNLRGKYKGSHNKFLRKKMQNLFWECALAPTLAGYNKAMQSMLDEGGRHIREFISDLEDLKHWACAFMEGNSYSEMCNNVVESFNSWITNYRFLPIFPMVDGIRIKMMRMMAERNVQCTSWHTTLCPAMEDLLKMEMDKGRNWRISHSHDYVYEVQADHSFAVDLSVSSCSCRQWMVKCFPCCHALAVIQNIGGSVYQFGVPYYTSAYYRNAYSNPINPIPDVGRSLEQQYKEFVVLPPLVKKQPGRPKTKRALSIGQSSSSNKCSRCGVSGHNKKTCNATLGV